MRILSLAVTLLALVSLLATGVSAQESYAVDAEDGFLAAINASRAEEGLPALLMNTELRGIARAWTDVMNADDELKHNPHYSEQYSGHWVRMGENVGYSSRNATNEEMVAALHQAFMNSAGHRANILGPYNQAGIGVVRQGNTMWVTVNFLDGDVPPADDAPAEVDQASSDGGHPDGPPPAPQGRRTWGQNY